MAKIGIMGFGVVGSAVAYGFRKLGHEIYVYDTNPERMKIAGRYGFNAVNIEAITECEFIFICVPTPCKIDGSCNLEYVEKAFWDLINTYKKKGNDRGQIIVVKSTVPPGTCEKLHNYAIDTEVNVHVVSCPEFLREKHAVEDFLNPDRWLGYVVIGGFEKDAVDKVAELYKDFGAVIVKTEPEVAEMSKYVSNLFHALKISFSNEIAKICERLDINPKKVMDILRIELNRATYIDPLLGPFTGKCLPKDLEQMLKLCESIGYDAPLLRAVKEVNERVKKDEGLEG